jgi:hypothetical protein
MRVCELYKSAICCKSDLPSFFEAISAKMKNLTCFFEGHGDQWEAICVDFDIGVAGRSFDEVKQSLLWAVSTYVEDAVKEDAKTRDRLLRRGSPLTVKIRWALKLAIHSLFKRARGREEEQGWFNLPCPA